MPLKNTSKLRELHGSPVVLPSSLTSIASPFVRNTSQAASPLLKDSQGRWRINSLFWEDRRPEIEPIYTLKDNSYTDGLGKTYPSLKELYLSYDHVPMHEYEFALDTLKSWTHWNVLCNSSYKEMIGEWRDELSVRIKANAIKKLISISREDTPAALNAVKYLADEGYLPKRAGRTSKEEKMRAVKQAAGIKDSLEEDMERILSVVRA